MYTFVLWYIQNFYLAEMLHVNEDQCFNVNLSTKVYICLILSIMTTQSRHWHHSGFFKINFDQILHIAVVFNCWLWASKYRLVNIFSCHFPYPSRKKGYIFYSMVYSIVAVVEELVLSVSYTWNRKSYS